MEAICSDIFLFLCTSFIRMLSPVLPNRSELDGDHCLSCFMHVLVFEDPRQSIVKNTLIKASRLEMMVFPVCLVLCASSH